MFFSGTTNVVADLERSRKFYEDLLGFEPDVFYAPTCWQSYKLQAGVFFGIGQPPGSTPSATFDVIDIEALWARVQDHPGVVEPLNRTPWGSVRFVIQDPDGNPLTFKSADAPQPADLKARFRQYFDRLLNQRDLSTCEEMLSADYRDHDAPEDDPPGPQETIAYVRNFLADYPDLRVEVHDLIAENDRVAGRLSWRGRHRQTGEPLEKDDIVILRFDSTGRIAERW